MINIQYKLNISSYLCKTYRGNASDAGQLGEHLETYLDLLPSSLFHRSCKYFFPTQMLVKVMLTVFIEQQLCTRVVVATVDIGLPGWW